MHDSTMSIPVEGQAVVHHCFHEGSGSSTWRVGEMGPRYSPTYLEATVTELVEFGERCIRAAIEHSSGMDPDAVWLEYLSVVLDRAQAEARRTNEARWPNLPWATDGGAAA